MALKGLDIFKLTPKTNCKDCGNPTCMAFAMKVASGALSIDKCPHMSPEALATLSEATAPPMKSYKVGELSLGGETVLSRHEKTLVSKTLYAVQVCDCMDEAKQDAVLAAIPNVDYERISERMYVEMIYVRHSADKTPADYAALVTKAKALGRPLVLSCTDLEAAKAGVEAASGVPFILNGATADNYADMSALAKGAKALLGVRAESLEALHQVVEKLEAAGNKDLILDVGEASIKDAYANAVQIRRAALKDGDRTFGYPSIVNVAGLAGGDAHLEAALLSLFTCKYGSIVVCSEMTYAKALPLYGLRQNIFTDPQKPMKVSPRHLSHQRRRREQPLLPDRGLRPDLLPGLRRAGAEQDAREPADHRRLRHVRADRLGRRQVLQLLHQEVLRRVRHQQQDQVPRPDHPRQGGRDEGRDPGEAARVERHRRHHRGGAAGEVPAGRGVEEELRGQVRRRCRPR